MICQVRKKWGLTTRQHQCPWLSEIPPPRLLCWVWAMGPSPGLHLGLAVALLREVFRSWSPHSSSCSSSEAIAGLAWVLCFSIRLCEDRCVWGGRTEQPYNPQARRGPREEPEAGQVSHLRGPHWPILHRGQALLCPLLSSRALDMAGVRCPAAQSKASAGAPRVWGIRQPGPAV